MQGRADVLAFLIAQLMEQRDLHQPLQLITALLRHRRVEALCALCCEMERAGNVAQMATLLSEAARWHGPPRRSSSATEQSRAHQQRTLLCPRQSTPVQRAWKDLSHDSS